MLVHPSIVTLSISQKAMHLNAIFLFRGTPKMRIAWDCRKNEPNKYRQVPFLETSDNPIAECKEGGKDTSNESGD